MIKLIRYFFKPSEDKILANKNAFYLAEKIIELQERIKEVEYENKCLRDNLSELQQKINTIQPVVYNISGKENLSNYSLGEK